TLFRWGYPNEPLVHEYGRTSLEDLDVSGAVSLDAQATDVWRRGPFYRMLQTGASLLRRRLNADIKDEFSMLADWLAACMTDYVAITTRFAVQGVIGEMDALYSSWGTKAAEGFNDSQSATLEYLVPHLALANKSVSLARMTRTLMETYLGRDAGYRVLRDESCAVLRSESTLSSGFWQKIASTIREFYHPCPNRMKLSA